LFAGGQLFFSIDTNAAPATGWLDWRGPQRLGTSLETGLPAKLDAKDPIGCDQPLSHSENGGQGGNILLKSGEVVTDHTGIWFGAARSGKCRP
jgi:hypothetical protein